jgi:hypothetical protein
VADEEEHGNDLDREQVISLIAKYAKPTGVARETTGLQDAGADRDRLLLNPSRDPTSRHGNRRQGETALSDLMLHAVPVCRRVG